MPVSGVYRYLENVAWGPRVALKGAIQGSLGNKIMKM